VKVTSLEVFVLNFPFKAVFVLAGGVAATPGALSPRVLVKVTADDGASGWGEATPTPRWTGKAGYEAGLHRIADAGYHNGDRCSCLLGRLGCRGIHRQGCRPCATSCPGWCAGLHPRQGEGHTPSPARSSCPDDRG
jgi:hypothetical protein